MRLMKPALNQAFNKSTRLNLIELIYTLAQKRLAAPIFVVLFVFLGPYYPSAPRGLLNFNALVGQSLPQKNETESEKNFDLLIDAIYQGKIVTVKEVLLNKVDVNAKKSDGNTPLHFAAGNTGVNNSTMIEMLIMAGADVNAKNGFGLTPLFYSIGAEGGGKRSASALIKAGADVNVADNNGMTPIIFATSAASLSSILLLLEAGADIDSQLPDGTTSLMIATKRAQAVIVRVLLQKGANARLTNKEGKTTFEIADEKFAKSQANPVVGSYMSEVIKILKTPPNSLTLTDLEKRGLVEKAARADRKIKLLFDAVRKGNIATVKLVIHQGVDVNAQDIYGKTPLHLAATWNEKNINLTMVKLLIKAGADANVKDQFGFTPLFYSIWAEGSGVPTTSSLIKAGADINVVINYGENPILAAAGAASIKSILLLLEAGAVIDSQLPDGTTSLMIVTRRAQTNIVQVLLQKGANTKLTNKEGKSALDIAEEEYNKKSQENPVIRSLMPEVIKLLKPH